MRKAIKQKSIETLMRSPTRHKIRITEELVTPGKIDVEAAFRSYKIDQEELSGKRVLDVGCWTGGFSFLFESFGAEVVALDVMDPEDSGFNLFKKHLNSKVRFERIGVYELSENELGKFDFVFMQGVFYHLKHPLLAFEKINEVMNTGGSLICSGTSGDYYFEYDDQLIAPDREFPKLNEFPSAFFVRDKFLGDKSNWWLPNEVCLEAWLKRSGFRCKWIITKEGGMSISGEPRSMARCVALKTGDPEPEHPYE